MKFVSTIRMVTAFAAVAVLSACSSSFNELDEPVDLGTFDLGFNVVVAKNAQKGPLSRNATPEEWEEVLEGEIARRFERYDGEKLFHIGVGIDGYALARPGIPIAFTPKSLLVISVNVWDDEANKKLTEKAKQFTIFESLSEKSLLGSGLTQTKEQQMLNLSFNAAKEIQDWLLENPEWFGLPPLPPEEPEFDTED